MSEDWQLHHSPSTCFPQRGKELLAVKHLSPLGASAQLFPGEK